MDLNGSYCLDYQKYSRGRKNKRNLISSFRRSFKGPRSLSSHGVGTNGDEDDNHLSPYVRIRSASENRGPGEIIRTKF